MSEDDAIYRAHGGRYAQNMNQEAARERRWAAEDRRRPSVLYRPRLFQDGDQWCALYGEDLQEGCAGFGDTPEDAMASFDDNWRGS